MKSSYTINELSVIVNRSVQTLYNLTSKCKAFEKLVEEHKTKHGRRTMYDAAVLEWLLQYYGIEKPEVQQEEKLEEKQEKAKEEPATSSVVDLERELAELKAKLAVLEAENKLMREQLSKCEADKEALQKQLDTALLTVQRHTEKEYLQEQRQFLLQKQQPILLEQPAEQPKKSIVDAVKGIFKKK